MTDKEQSTSGGSGFSDTKREVSIPYTDAARFYDEVRQITGTATYTEGPIMVPKQSK